jgi:hypothetical protein
LNFDAETQRRREKYYSGIEISIVSFAGNLSNYYFASWRLRVRMHIKKKPRVAAGLFAWEAGGNKPPGS